MSLRLQQLPFPLEIHASKSTATQQLSQQSQRSPNASSICTLEVKVKNQRFQYVKPMFQPPRSKCSEPETEPDDGVSFSYDFKTSFPYSKAEPNGTKAGQIPIFPTKQASSSKLPERHQPESPKLNEMGISDEVQHTGNNSIVATGIKDSDSEYMESFDSGTVFPVDVNQIEKLAFFEKSPEPRKCSLGTVVSHNVSKNPSKFALDGGNRNFHFSIDMNRNTGTHFVTEELPSSPTGNGARSAALIYENIGRRKWGKLSHVIQSLTMFQRPEATNIHDMKEITNEINTFQLRQPNATSGSAHDKPIYQKKEYKLEPTKDAFDFIRRVATFCDCARVGAKRHIDMMKKILEKDPKKHLFEKSDPDHILNKWDSEGHTPLYIAAQNGNLEVVKFLIESGVEPLIESRVNSENDRRRIPLEVAVIWDHVSVVEYLLSTYKYSKEIMKRCSNLTQNKNVKKVLKEYSSYKN